MNTIELKDDKKQYENIDLAIDIAEMRSSSPSICSLGLQYAYARM